MDSQAPTFTIDILYDLGLTVNVERTKAMTFKNGSIYSGREKWTYRGEALEKCKKLRLFGNNSYNEW